MYEWAENWVESTLSVNLILLGSYIPQIRLDRLDKTSLAPFVNIGSISNWGSDLKDGLRIKRWLQILKKKGKMT